VHEYWWDCEKNNRSTGIKPDTSWRKGLKGE
jgi:hypothetical protein